SPCDLSCATSSEPSVSFTSAATTEAPSRAKRAATARPRPTDAPVTMVTLPDNLMHSHPFVCWCDWGSARGSPLPCRDCIVAVKNRRRLLGLRKVLLKHHDRRTHAVVKPEFHNI